MLGGGGGLVCVLLRVFGKVESEHVGQAGPAERALEGDIVEGVLGFGCALLSEKVEVLHCLIVDQREIDVAAFGGDHYRLETLLNPHGIEN